MAISKEEDGGPKERLRCTACQWTHWNNPTPVLAAALFARFRSRQEASFADKALSAMRHGFGGHLEPK